VIPLITIVHCHTDDTVQLVDDRCALPHCQMWHVLASRDGFCAAAALAMLRPAGWDTTRHWHGTCATSDVNRIVHILTYYTLSVDCDTVEMFM